MASGAVSLVTTDHHSLALFCVVCFLFALPACLVSLLSMDAACGLVHNVYLVGAAVHVNEEEWQQVYRLISGRLVNIYWPGDTLLETVCHTIGGFPASSAPVAGLQPVPFPFVENHDISGCINSHFEYCTSMSEVLMNVNVTV